ncbi:glycoside hydrolase superfamily [Ochromonadaceae sp. CCMP2298]|nr:glycoside hydrolase superfamily [Ochromonadaceae sp. CCMP2298]|mmetsp:Transcript_2215/g.5264  ORF Transcript_2215/g.5264 Transcript_2215/m.5264 type:complete len:249 (-) Transcript_2215:816-1562(-)
MPRLFLLVLVLVSFCWQCSGRLGVDLSVPADEAAWSCLKDQEIGYAIVRVYRSVGEIDTNSAATILSAHEQKLRDVGAYIFPCVQTSPYSMANNITCKSAELQLEETVHYLASNGIYFDPRQGGVTLDRLWVDVEDESPSKYYDADPTANQIFMQALVGLATKLGLPIGMYTTKTYWTQIMADSEAYSGLDSAGRYVHPLWYPRYDAVNSMDFFSPFAGWDRALIKQTGGDVGLCGLTQVDSNYMDDL